MFGWFKKKEVYKPVLSVDPYTVAWRNHMWVATPEGIGIIFKLGKVSNVHLVNEDGETVKSQWFNIDELRQAMYLEIPAKRRQVSKEQAFSMGYR